MTEHETVVNSGTTIPEAEQREGATAPKTLLQRILDVSLMLLGGFMVLQIIMLNQQGTALPIADQLILLFANQLTTAIAIFVRLKLSALSRVSALSMMILILCLPVVGVVVVSLVLHQQNHQVNAAKGSVFSSISLAGLPDLHNATTAPRPNADLIYILRHGRSVRRKLRALETAERLPKRQAIAIFRQAMLDNSDEVRLIGVTHLKRIERELNTNITDAKARHDHTQSQAESAEVQSEAALALALAYFDFLYYGFGDAAMRPYYQSQAQHYCELSLKHHPLPEAQLLAARLALISQAPAQAETLLQELVANQEHPPQHIYPYLAEAAFGRQAYGQISRILHAAASRSPTLAKARRFWL